MKNLNLMRRIVLIIVVCCGFNLYAQEATMQSVTADMKVYQVSMEYNVGYTKTARQNYSFTIKCSDETEKCSLHFKIKDQDNRLLFDIMFSDKAEPMLSNIALYSDVTDKTLEEVLPAINNCKELDSLFSSMYNQYLAFSEDIKFNEASNTYEGYEYNHATPLVFLSKSVLQLSLLLKEKANTDIDECQREHQLVDVPVLFWKLEMCPIAKISKALNQLSNASVLLGVDYQMACTRNYNNSSSSRLMLMGDDGRDIYIAPPRQGCPGYEIGHKLRQYGAMYESAQEQYIDAWYAK
ncbi:MAG TPA: hypothetical protein PKC21_05340 [Oligoflexia bacterium]|nr:hypothetical protein [Oligoflexia bacterium]HMR24760.1 hypothetical protein [Oligoflexia bacterium]